MLKKLLFKKIFLLIALAIAITSAIFAFIYGTWFSCIIGVLNIGIAAYYAYKKRIEWSNANNKTN